MNTKLRISTGTGPLVQCRERKREVDERDNKHQQDFNAF